MTKKQKKSCEFHYRPVIEGENILALLGTGYIQENPSKKHFHNLLEIAVCRRGEGEILIDKTKFRYTEGTIMVIPPNKIHAIICDEGKCDFWEYLYIKPSVIFMQADPFKKAHKLSQYLQEERVIVKDRNNAVFLYEETNLLMNQMRVKEDKYSQYVWGIIYALLLEIIKIYQDTDSNPGNFEKIDKKNSISITNALDYVDAHYGEDIRTSDIAKEVFLSETSIRKFFREYFDMSPGQYVNYIRIKKACELIKHTDSSISETAHAVGYENLSTFINNFRLYTGDTPSKWKEKQSKNVGGDY